MNHARRLVLLSLALALAACATDGGPVGSGISSAILGNVTVVDSTPPASGEASTDRVHVSIEGLAGVESTTNDAGDFELSGDFSGFLVLRFSSGEVNATQQIDVPAGSTVVLDNVELRPQRVHIDAVRQLGFFGSVGFVDCAGGVIGLNDRRPMANQFLVRLSDDTSFARGNGDALECSQIRKGSNIAVEGIVRLSDRTIEAVTVTLTPPRPGQPPPVGEQHFRGTVVVANCQNGMIQLIDERVGRTRLNLLRSSIIVKPDQIPIRCHGIDVGDRVEGRGFSNARDHDAVDVTFMIVRPPAG